MSVDTTTTGSHLVGLEPISAPHPPPPPRPVEDRLAPLMFWLAVFDLLLVAGLIHRASREEATTLELQIIMSGLGLIWPIFAVESVLAFLRRAPDVSAKKAFGRVALVWIFPPARLGWIHPATKQIWLPRAGWMSPGKDLLKRLDKLFGVPMLLFAFLILPVLAAEYLASDAARATVPGFALAVDIAVAVIWVAFAFEFILKASASPKTLVYFKERWLDAAIVLLPTLEVVFTRVVDAAPIARLLRLGRAMAPEQMAKMGKIYRLRGLMMKGWHAFLLLEGVARITGSTPAKRLRKIEEQIADLEEVLAELRREADELRQVVPEATPEPKPASG